MNDRAKLEEAISKAHAGADRASLDAVCVSHDALKTIIAAAEAHLTTLPKTKMVEVWRVEYAQRSDDKWRPGSEAFFLKEEADGRSGGLARSPSVSCVHVTGPHQQEIPI